MDLGRTKFVKLLTISREINQLSRSEFWSFFKDFAVVEPWFNRHEGFLFRQVQCQFLLTHQNRHLGCAMCDYHYNWDILEADDCNYINPAGCAMLYYRYNWDIPEVDDCNYINPAKINDYTIHRLGFIPLIHEFFMAIKTKIE